MNLYGLNENFVLQTMVRAQRPTPTGLYFGSGAILRRALMNSGLI
jgi:hypothetical protein